MNDEREVGLVFIIGLAVGLSFGYGVTSWYYTSSAVKHGVAEYVITKPTTGATEFRWREPETKAEAAK